MKSDDSAVKVSVRPTASHGVFMVAAASGRERPAAAAAGAYAAICDTLRAGSLAIVQERVFGSFSAEAAVRTARRDVLRSRGVRDDGPCVYLQGRPTDGEGFAGVIVRAADARTVRVLSEDGVPCGRSWQSDGVICTILQNVRGLSGGPDADDEPAAQARRAIDRARRLLRSNGADYRDTVRTWFYLSDILRWYGDFNLARNAAYREFGLLTPAGEPAGPLPASTGICADSPGGAACSLDLFAVSGASGNGAAVEFLRNPRQAEAYRYGSAFSRCAAVRMGRETLIELSGTAAIDETGRSLYPGDVAAQTRCTLEKIAALLEPAGASLRDICAATVFLKRGRDADAARRVLVEFGLEAFPSIWVEADVCREELLFEIDAEAVAAPR